VDAPSAVALVGQTRSKPVCPWPDIAGRVQHQLPPVQFGSSALFSATKMLVTMQTELLQSLRLSWVLRPFELLGSTSLRSIRRMTPSSR
jgi:hypothetical protein